MAKAIVNDSCIGCGVCESVAPEIFVIKDDGLAHVLKDDIAGSEDQVNDALTSCPVEAIVIE